MLVILDIPSIAVNIVRAVAFTYNVGESRSVGCPR